MKVQFLKSIIAACCLQLCGTFHTDAQESRMLATGQADAIVDLKSETGTSLVMAEWKFSPASIVEVPFNSPGPKADDPLALYPTGEAITTHALLPKANSADFDDSTWEVLDPASLETRRGSGLLSFVWYRLRLRIPDSIGTLPVQGTSVVFELTIDDYAEIWVNGKQQKRQGQNGNGLIAGWNTPNRVLLTNDATPGEEFHIAILGANGPFSDLPSNYIWIRSATLDFYEYYPPVIYPSVEHQLHVYDPALESILDIKEVQLQQIASGFQFIEGPVWHPEGYLLFSDPNTNVIYRYEPNTGNVAIHITKSGYTGIDIGDYHQPGSNGLAIDAEGRLLVCQHGNRRLIRHELKGPITVLSAAFDGKRLNSPNDLVIKSDNSVYFTDPPYGLPSNYTDSKKELDEQGIYRIKEGKTELLTTALGGPNGIAFSPDEDYLYAGNWDIRDIKNTKTVWRFPVLPNGLLGKGEIFFDFGSTPEDEGIDGIKTDDAGNLFVSAPGGLWIISPQGKVLGKLTAVERPANMAWGDDGKTLYLTAHTGLYKIRVKTGKNLQS